MHTSIRSDSANLDLLRSIAVLVVVISHLPVAAYFGSNYHLGALGLLGVAIFFVHTCLVLMLSLERQTEKYGTERSASVFLIRRIFRIYPLSMIVVLLLSAIAYLGPTTQHPPSFLAIVSNLLLVQNFTQYASIPGALWSLPFEVQMYLFLPFLFVLVDRSGSVAPRYLLALWIAAAGFVLTLWGLGIKYYLVKYFPCFLPGVLAFALRNRRPTWGPSILFLYVAANAIIFPYLVALGLKENLLTWPICLGLGLLIPRCSEMQSQSIHEVAKVIAKYSYGIYLIHGPCIKFAFGYLDGTNVYLQCAIFVIGTGGLSYLAYHAVEKPGIEWGAKISHKFATARVQQHPQTALAS